MAGPTFDTFLAIQPMGLFFLSRDRIDRTGLETCSAAGAPVRIDEISDQFLADLGRTSFVFDMGVIFIPEIPDRR